VPSSRHLINEDNACACVSMVSAASEPNITVDASPSPGTVCHSLCRGTLVPT